MRRLLRNIRFTVAHPQRSVQVYIERNFQIPDPNDQERRTELVIKSRKSNVVQGFWMFFLSIAVGISLGSIENERGRFRHASQESRFASAYVSCLASNEGHVRGLRDISSILSDPTEARLRDLVQDFRPLRTLPPKANVTAVTLPNPIPKPWERGCQLYASVQVALGVPSAIPIPKILHVEPSSVVSTPTTSSSTSDDGGGH